MKVKIGISNHHVHLTQKDLETLFGSDYKLNKIADLNQPGQFVTDSFVCIKTDKSTIEKVRVLGPVRNYTQIEISKTDSYHLGINPPVRDSGDLDGSEIVTLIGPKGQIKTNGCIIATRHIHILMEDAIKLGLDKYDKVSVKIGKEKSSIINDVHIKISDKSYYEMHLDTDDANACLLKNGDIGEIII